jgi:protein involved in polysaccharide export with SLBB domain
MYSKPIFYIILIFIFLGISTNTSNGLSGSQTLSDQEVQNLISQAKKSGYRIDKIVDFARLKGLSESDISALMPKASQQGSSGAQEVSSPAIRTSSSPAPVGLAESPNQATSSTSRIFGSSISNNPNLPFSPDLNMPTPQGYILGSGDQINVQLWGRTELSLSLTITPEGYVTTTSLGPIYVNGLTIEKATSVINSQLNRIYDGLIPSINEKPTVFSLVTLGQIRSIQVTVVGEITAPGNSTLNSLSTIYTALYAAGGPSINGTFRDIQLIRNNELHTSLDIYDFIINGTRNEDVILEHNDVILIKPYSARVSLAGRTKRIGLFEINEDESLANSLEFASGYEQDADRTKLLVIWYAKAGTRLMTIKSNEIDNFKLQDGGFIRVSPFNNKYVNSVVIEGAVMNTEQYELTEKLPVKDLISEAGGLRGDAYEKTMLPYGVTEIFDQEVFSFNLAALMSGDTDDILFKPDDIVEIKSRFSTSEEPYVRVTGEVAKPTVYPYFSNITPNELILLAGGIRTNASTEIEIYRVNKQENNSYKSEIIKMDRLDNDGDSNLNLSRFDRVYVRQNSDYVLNRELRITGEVQTPGLFALTNDQERISEIIKRAQGLTEYAYPEGAILIRKSELSSGNVGFVTDQSAINGLRKKISENSGIRPNVKESLTKRVDLISEESYSGLNTSLVTESRRAPLRRSVAQSNSSLSLQLPDYEPVAIDLTEILKNPSGNADLFLRVGDLISIPSELETVRVSGEIVSNIILPYSEKKSFKGYIDESGGYMQSSLKGRSYVQYPNGERAGVKRFLIFQLHPKILPGSGSTIVIAKKRERAPLNLSNAVSPFGSLLTAALLVDRLTDENRDKIYY